MRIVTDNYRRNKILQIFFLTFELISEEPKEGVNLFHGFAEFIFYYNNKTLK